MRVKKFSKIRMRTHSGLKIYFRWRYHLAAAGADTVKKRLVLPAGGCRAASVFGD
jgi:hypothetical protein